MPKDTLNGPIQERRAHVRVPMSRPLRHARYRRLWCANLVSNLGTWTQTFASAWLIASLSHSASVTTLVQTAAYLPIVLFALFAGVLADRMERPKYLFFCNLFMALCACAMAVLVMSGRASAAPVLALTFCVGMGSAFMWPAWQAAMAELVEPDEIEAAGSLNNLSYNVAAIAGPALGGLMFNWIGAGALFWLNALSFLGILSVYWLWWREGGAVSVAPSRFLRSLTTGFGTAFGCARFRHLLGNVGGVFFSTIVFASLLPLFVRDVLRLDSNVFGTLMGSLGVGAVAAAFILPGVRCRFDRSHLLAGAMFVYAAMLLAIPLSTSLMLLVPLIVCGGMAWSTIVTTLNAAAQASFGPAVRARTMSIYLFVMAGGYTAGSVAWGWVADRFGVRAAFAAAGLSLMLIGLRLLARKRETPI